MESLYLSHEKFFGFLKARPLIPGGQVWVFQQWNGECYVMRGMEDDPMPPRAPFLERHATSIYKFRRSAVYPWSITLFEEAGLPIRVDTLVTVELRDPVAFILSGQFESDNFAKLDFALVKALRKQLGDDVQPQVNLQVVSPNLHDLTPPALSQLLPDTDLSPYIQGLREFIELGMEARVIVRNTQMPPAYQEIVHKATIAIQEQLLDAKRQMVAAITGFEIKKLESRVNFDIMRDELTFNEELYRTQVGYYEKIFPKIQPVIQEIIKQVGGVAQSGFQPALAATVFNDIIQQTVNQISHGSTSGIASGGGGQIPPLQGNQRDSDIQALYQAGLNAGWLLSPAQNSVLDEITIDWGNKCRIILKVPRNYPKVNALITEVRNQGQRVSQIQVNKIVQPVTRGGKYTLHLLVQAVIDSI